LVGIFLPNLETSLTAIGIMPTQSFSVLMASMEVLWYIRDLWAAYLREMFLIMMKSNFS
jgi:hypothetical protein